MFRRGGGGCRVRRGCHGWFRLDLRRRRKRKRYLCDFCRCFLLHQPPVPPQRRSPQSLAIESAGKVILERQGVGWGCGVDKRVCMRTCFEVRNIIKCEIVSQFGPLSFDAHTHRTHTHIFIFTPFAVSCQYLIDILFLNTVLLLLLSTVQIHTAKQTATFTFPVRQKCSVENQTMADCGKRSKKRRRKTNNGNGLISYSFDVKCEHEFGTAFYFHIFVIIVIYGDFWGGGFVHVLFDSILMWCFCPCCHYALCLGFVPLLHIFKELSFQMCMNSWGHFHYNCTYHHSHFVWIKSQLYSNIHVLELFISVKKKKRKKEIWNQVDSQHSEQDHKTQKGWRECWF